MPDKLAQMRELFAIEAARNSVLPIGGGLWVPIFHPELRITPPYREWEFSGDITRMPEFCAPALGNKNNTVTIEADLPADANGVLYALGGFAGGVTCYLDDGYLCYEYNLFHHLAHQDPLGDQTAGRPDHDRRRDPLCRSSGPPDRSTSPSESTRRSSREGRVPVSAPLLFTANDCLDIGSCLGSPVSLDYYDKAPFRFNGHIDRVHVAYT